MAGWISLGCAKNTVDSERLLAGLVADGWRLAGDPADSDVCLVNTCGFIAPAREETRRALAALAGARRRRGRPRRIVALGCLVERSGSAPETAASLEGADARIGFADYARLPALCRALLEGGPGAAAPAVPGARPSAPPGAFHALPRLLTGPPHCVSLKISEGCSNRCSFCSIPLIRGPQVSRPAAGLVREAQALAAAGAREIGLVAQDTTAYGRDRPGRTGLAGLVRRLSAALGPGTWLRLMYAHPRRVTDELLRALRDEPGLCPYLDLPLQHIADPVLRAMGRGMGRGQTLRRLDRIAALWPEAALRTTFLVGFPGETEADFQALRALVAEGRFLHVGVFAYSPEPGTPAARRPGTPDPREALRRRDLLLGDQRAVSGRLLREWVGRTVEVMADGPWPGARGARPAWRARTRWQAPEVDGAVRLFGAPPGLRPGDVLRVRVRGAGPYDLRAEAPPGGIMR